MASINIIYIKRIIMLIEVRVMFEYYHGEDRQPPFGPPGFGPPTFVPPGFGAGGPPSGGAAGGPPSGPPPSIVPQQSQSQSLTGPSVYAVDPGAIRRCIYRYVYIWLNTGEQFWAWLTFVGRRSAAGWRWTGYRWIYFGVDLRNISSFTCY